MKIAIDISPIVYGTGVSLYTKELVKALLKIDSKNHYILFGGSLRRKDELSNFLGSLNAPNFTGKVFSIAPSLADILWNRFHKLPIESLIGKVDVFHSSDWTQPTSAAYKVTTIHDLVPIKYPEWSNEKIVSVHRRRLGWVKDEVDSIIVPSKQTKIDLMEIGFKGRNVEIISESVNSDFVRTSDKEIAEAKRNFKIDGKYLIGIGINIRKNTQRIIEAFMNLTALPNFGNYKLVLVGHPYTSVNTSKEVIITGHIDDHDYSALLSGAEALIYPSLYEGFGIPILEAMKVGTPVVTSHVGSMREVAGNAAILVDPLSVDSITAGIKKAITLQKSLIVKGKKREKEFSWEKAAEMTLKVYENAQVKEI